MAEPLTDVLLVDDNLDVREGLARVLRRAGYRVATAENGLDALAKVSDAEFQAVICDIMMPVMDGIRLYEALTAKYPRAASRVVFVSAWFDDPEVQAFLTRTGRPVLQKPFEIQDFLRAVKETAA